MFLIIGVPCSGKSWVAMQVSKRFQWVPHDDFKESEYPSRLIKAAKRSELPVLGEIPFGLSKIKEEIENYGLKVVTVCISEEEPVLRSRYFQRERKEMPSGRMKLQETQKSRALEAGSFVGTSSEVLKFLKEIPL